MPPVTPIDATLAFRYSTKMFSGRSDNVFHRAGRLGVDDSMPPSADDDATALHHDERADITSNYFAPDEMPNFAKHLTPFL